MENQPEKRKRRQCCRVCVWGGGALKQISAAERHIVSSADDVSDSYLARLDPALPPLTSKSEPGDDGNRK